MKTISYVILMFVGGMGASAGYGFGQETAAEAPAIPTMVYDCRRLTASATLVNCTCLQGNEVWTCAFPAHREPHHKGPIQ